MSNQNVKEMYDQVLKKVILSPQIQGCRRGLLYNTILVILREEQLQAPENTKEICDQLGIERFASEDNDFEIIASMNELFIDRLPFPEWMINNEPIKSTISRISTQMNRSLISKDKKMEWIVLAACTLIGLYYIQFFNNSKRRKVNQSLEDEETKLLSSHQPQVSAALCLVVPAKIVSALKTDSSLSVTKVEQLIDNAPYFLCTTVKEANSNEQSLELLLDEYISPDSNRDVYIRIDINDGQNLIKKNLLYELKKNLPTNEEFIIKQLACLKNLSGIEKFNRL